MTLRIHGDSTSGNCLKVRWTADYLKLSYDWIETSVAARQTREAVFLKLHPAGQVPLLILDDGRPLAQSNAIIAYLAEGSSLIPADAFERARMFEWMFWEQNSHEPYVAVARRLVRIDGVAISALDPILVERGRGALSRLDAGLGGRDFLVGSALSLADICLIAYTRVAGEGGLDLAPFPALRGWIARVEAAAGIGAA